MSLTDVALSFSKEVLLTNETKGINTVFSPLSIHAMLGLIGAGSKGSTQDQILSFLKLKSNDDLISFSYNLASLLSADDSLNGGPCLSFANSLWIDKSLTLKPSFKQVVDNVYKATYNEVDFQNEAEGVRDQVNSWAKMKTNGLINEILPFGSVTDETRLLLANALFFKGIWLNKFNPLKTKDYHFNLLNGTSIKAPFMASKQDKIVRCFNDFKVVKLPYNHFQDEPCFSMYIFLPNARDGLQVLVDKLCFESGFLDRHLPHERVSVDKFLIPRFKVSLGFEASRILRGLGVELPFTRGADLTEMVDSSDMNLYVEKIYHESFLEVNEQGTEAAAATATAMYGSCGRVLVDPSRVDFVADHPFLFFVREDTTKTIFFIGHLLNPRLT